MSYIIRGTNDKRVVPFIGKKFNSLTALRFVSMDRKGRTGSHQLWEFQCDCGKRVIRKRSRVEFGYTKSCGCLKMTALLKHGFAANNNRRPMYVDWKGMIQRCTNPKSARWPYYGGRGITVCDRWRSFINFLADMGEKPEGMTIERIDNDGNYCPENCRWGTRRDQSLNKRTARLLTHNGQTLNLSVWVERTGFSRGAIMGRLNRGWSVDRALSTPV